MRPDYYRRRRRRKNPLKIVLMIAIPTIALAIAAAFIISLIPGAPNILDLPRKETRAEKRLKALNAAEIPDWITPALLDQYNDDAASDSSLAEPRSKLLLDDMTAVVIHYVANPGTTAQQNRNYFNKPDTSTSSHFIVGLKGEILQCVPLPERSAASNDRNRDTISIEVCHPDKTGKFNDATYDSVVKLTAWLADLCELQHDDIIRHYDVTGKLCPLYFVNHEDAWGEFKDDVYKIRGKKQ